MPLAFSWASCDETIVMAPLLEFPDYRVPVELSSKPKSLGTAVTMSSWNHSAQPRVEKRPIETSISYPTNTTTL